MTLQISMNVKSPQVVVTNYVLIYKALFIVHVFKGMYSTHKIIQHAQVSELFKIQDANCKYS